MSRDFARQLRKNLTDPERRLWYAVRAYRFDGWKFRRQQPIGLYIADFLCFEARLIIELDGSQHATCVEKDEARTAFLNSRGFRVIRFWNCQILEEFDSVLEAIEIALTFCPRVDPAERPEPSPAKGE